MNISFQRCFVRLSAMIIAATAATSVLAAERVALVIGQGAYEAQTKLATPTSDAVLVGTALQRLGFDVTTVKDATKPVLLSALGDFSEKAAGTEIAVIFYSGHGMAYQGENYLIPVDAQLSTPAKLRFEAVSFEDVASALDGATKLKLLFLDASRSSSAEDQSSDHEPVGLEAIEVSDARTLVSSSTAAGAISPADGGPNSVYAMALAKWLAEPKIDVRSLLEKTASEVRATTKNEQSPILYGEFPIEELQLSMRQPDKQALEDLAPETECDRLAAYRDDPLRLASVSPVEKLTAEAVPACIAAVNSYPDSARLNYQAGRALTNANNYDEALRYYKRANELGSIPAKVGMAFQYEFGQSVQADTKLACDLYLEAAKAGSSFGALRTGLCYQDGRGGNKDIKESIRWYSNAGAMGFLYLGDLYADVSSEFANQAAALKAYRRSYEAGIPLGAYYIGEMYEYGKGIPVDYAEAMRWYLLAAEHIGDGSNSVGDLYYYGKGVEQSYVEAMKWYRKAAQRGDRDAMTNIGILYDDGKGTEPDAAAALEWYKKAVEKDESEAMYRMGSLYLNGRGVPKDLSKSGKWYTKAAENGYKDALNQVGWVHQNSTPPDYVSAMEWYRKGAEAGDGTAMGNIGWLYANGKGVKRNPKEAFAWYEKGANAGNAWSMNEVGVSYSKGIGVKKSLKEAGLWYEKAAASGLDYANLNLAILFSRGLGLKTDVALAVDLMERAIRRNKQACSEFKSGWANWHPEFLKAFQKRLVDQGFYTGKVDGRYGEGTLAAIDAMHAAGP